MKDYRTKSILWKFHIASEMPKQILPKLLPQALAYGSKMRCHALIYSFEIIIFFIGEKILQTPCS